MTVHSRQQKDVALVIHGFAACFSGIAEEIGALLVHDNGICTCHCQMKTCFRQLCTLKYLEVGVKGGAKAR